MGFKDYETMREYQNRYLRDKYKNDPEFRKKYLEKKAKWRKDKKYNHYQPQTDERRAYDRIKYALKSGKIIKSKTCEYCDKETKLQAHHVDYKQPLKVFWLCPPCHKSIHRRADEIWKFINSLSGGN